MVAIAPPRHNPMKKQITPTKTYAIIYPNRLNSPSRAKGELLT